MKSSVEILIENINNMEDYNEVAESLLALSRIDSDLSKKFALEIISKYDGDKYLRSSCFVILYRIDRGCAFDLIRDMSSSCDPYMFSTMLDEVVGDVGCFDDSSDLREIVRLLLKIIPIRNGNFDDNSVKAVEAFLKMYGHVSR